jgi:hypothetical protein
MSSLSSRLNFDNLTELLWICKRVGWCLLPYDQNVLTKITNDSSPTLRWLAHLSKNELSATGAQR